MSVGAVSNKEVHEESEKRDQEKNIWPIKTGPLSSFWAHWKLDHMLVQVQISWLKLKSLKSI